MQKVECLTANDSYRKIIVKPLIKVVGHVFVTRRGGKIKALEQETLQ